MEHFLTLGLVSLGLGVAVAASVTAPVAVLVRLPASCGYDGLTLFGGLEPEPGVWDHPGNLPRGP